MFTDRYFGKGRFAKKADIKTASSEPAGSEPSREAGLAAFTSDDPDARLSADHVTPLALDEFARLHGLSEAEVLEAVRRGRLAARMEAGSLRIYRSEPAAAQTNCGEHINEHGAAQSDGNNSDHRMGASANTTPDTALTYLSLSGDRGPAPELALLLDHLSLAKDENREILKLTQDSLRKVSELSEQIVAMKNQVIGSKDAEIELLRGQLAERDRLMQKLRQQNEDLEMLARAVMDGKDAAAPTTRSKA